MAKFFPGYYYFFSRYGDKYSFLIYMIKYWFLNFLTYYIFLNDTSIAEPLLKFILFLVSHYALYDYFCYKNDYVSLSEKNGTLRETYVLTTINKIALFSSWIIVVLVSRLYFEPLNVVIIIYSVCISVIFYIHNNIREKLRPITYYFLYVMKQAMPLLVFVNFDDFSLSYPEVLFTLLYPVTYLIGYTFKKFGMKGYYKSLKPIYFKVLLIISFSFVEFKLSLILILLVLFTCVELYVKKKL